MFYFVLIPKFLYAQFDKRNKGIYTINALSSILLPFFYGTLTSENTIFFENRYVAFKC